MCLRGIAMYYAILADDGDWWEESNDYEFQ